MVVSLILELAVEFDKSGKSASSLGSKGSTTVKNSRSGLFSFSFTGEGFDSMDEIVTSLVSEEAGEFDKSEINASTSGSKGSINEKMSKSMILVKFSSVKSLSYFFSQKVYFK